VSLEARKVLSRINDWSVAGSCRLDEEPASEFECSAIGLSWSGLCSFSSELDCGELDLSRLERSSLIRESKVTSLGELFFGLEKIDYWGKIPSVVNS
jgi:hypothetical protein